MDETKVAEVCKYCGKANGEHEPFCPAKLNVAGWQERCDSGLFCGSCACMACTVDKMPKGWKTNAGTLKGYVKE